MSKDPNVNPIDRAREITGYQPTYQQQVANKDKEDAERMEKYKRASGGSSSNDADLTAQQSDEIDQLKARLDSIEQLVRAR